MEALCTGPFHGDYLGDVYIPTRVAQHRNGIDVLREKLTPNFEYYFKARNMKEMERKRFEKRWTRNVETYRDIFEDLVKQKDIIKTKKANRHFTKLAAKTRKEDVDDGDVEMIDVE